MESNETTVKSFGKDEVYCEWFECLKCGDSMITDSSKFCPNCGRKIIPPLTDDK